MALFCFEIEDVPVVVMNKRAFHCNSIVLGRDAGRQKTPIQFDLTENEKKYLPDQASLQVCSDQFGPKFVGRIRNGKVHLCKFRKFRCAQITTRRIGDTWYDSVIVVGRKKYQFVSIDSHLALQQEEQHVVHNLLFRCFQEIYEYESRLLAEENAAAICTRDGCVGVKYGGEILLPMLTKKPAKYRDENVAISTRAGVQLKSRFNHEVKETEAMIVVAWSDPLSSMGLCLLDPDQSIWFPEFLLKPIKVVFNKLTREIEFSLGNFQYSFYVTTSKFDPMILRLVDQLECRYVPRNPIFTFRGNWGMRDRCLEIFPKTIPEKIFTRNEEGKWFGVLDYVDLTFEPTVFSVCIDPKREMIDAFGLDFVEDLAKLILTFAYDGFAEEISKIRNIDVEEIASNFRKVLE
jgi:hypothetical protein